MTDEPRGDRTLKVTWHPNAVTGAVERAAAATAAATPDDVCQVHWMDLACLLDLARAVLAEPGEEHRETELWQVLDWSLWGNGLGDGLRTAMADTMVTALPDEQREQAEACIKAWHAGRGPSMAVGEGTELARQRDAFRELLGAIWLYVDWRYVTRQLTTEQKNLWADAIDNSGNRAEYGPTAERWWIDG